MFKKRLTSPYVSTSINKTHLYTMSLFRVCTVQTDEVSYLLSSPDNRTCVTDTNIREEVVDCADLIRVNDRVVIVCGTYVSLYGVS